MTYSGKVVIVTGASSGIGAATAVMFCREGAHVVLVGRNADKLKKTSQDCTKVGGKHVVVKADVSNDEDARRIINETLKKFNQIDVLVNNAGVIDYGTLLEGTALTAYDKIMKINLRAVFHLTMLATPHLVKTKGNVVNISSAAANMSFHPFFMAYCSSKAALNMFTKAAALELAPSGVRVNAISPGPVETDILEQSGSAPISLSDVKTRLNRLSQPEEIADFILFVAGDKAKGITGSILVSDNGVLLN